MIKRTCPKCEQSWYSADAGIWQCSGCGTHLTEVNDKPINERGKENVIMCDLCKTAEAQYDGKTQFGPWGYMCDECFAKYGIGSGLGKGQKLIKGRC